MALALNETGRSLAALVRAMCDPRVPVQGFRYDIEGLRAAAVLPIVLFHLGVPGFPGGFVGVDIFFVISGYLIGGALIAEIDEGKFSIARFYQRRLRRIIPSLLVVIAATLAAGTILLLPSDLARLSDSILASLVYLANIYFWWTTDYFSQEAHVSPLLHLWSLGVEEQFYVLFPLVAIAIARFARPALWPALVLLALASFMLSVELTFSAPQANFFLLPMRTWELLGGVLVAITPLVFLRWRIAREIVTIGSLALLIWAVATYTEYTPFPGWRAAIPCAGAAGIIAAGRYGPSLVGQLFSTLPLRFFGQISYSLYLWHWPIIVLLLMSLPATVLPPAMQILAGGLSVLLATASLYLVERPFRKTGAPLRVVFGWSAAGSGAIALLAAVTLWSGGWPNRFDPATQRIAAALDYEQDEEFRAGACFLIEDSQTFDKRKCLAAEPGKPRVALLGDSHAAHLWPGLHQHFTGSAILQITASGCRPLVEHGPWVSERCRKLMDWAFSDYLQKNPVDLVILSGLWLEEDLPGLGKTLAQLRARGQRVMVIGPAPAWTLSVPRLLALGHLRGDEGLAERFRSPERRLLNAEMAQLVARYGQPYISLRDLRCTPKCSYLDEAGNPEVVDDGHISVVASIKVAAAIKDPALIR